MSLLLASRAGIPSPPSALEAAFGWIATGLLAGEFSDAWRRSREQNETENADLHLRLERLSRDHHALVASHERLRRQVPGESTTLHDSLQGLGQALGNHTDPDALSALAGPILRFFAEHAYMQSGSLHAFDREGCLGPAAAELGAATVPADDPLLIAAVDSGEVTSVRERGEGSVLLCAVPLVDTEGRVHAAVAIRDMPFVSLHDGTLALLATIGAYLGDAIARSARHPREATPPQLALERQPVRSLTELGVPPETALGACAAGAGTGSPAPESAR
jgi:hypothetical protein